ncbi:hypothetical protein C8R44DRAFT_196518 [Mycena epipterygia]|nr:hypothetical protein C8R44DRAFT_196518 [Mycena epipterygia]
MLQSTDTRILKYASRMLGRISNHAEALKIPIGRLGACIHLVSLAEHSDASVQQEALSTLVSISVGSEIGAQAIAGARDLGWTIRLAYSPVDSIRGSALQILGSIARHESTKARVNTLSEDLISLVRVRCPSFSRSNGHSRTHLPVTGWINRSRQRPALSISFPGGA